MRKHQRNDRSEGQITGFLMGQLAAVFLLFQRPLYCGFLQINISLSGGRRVLLSAQPDFGLSLLYSHSSLFFHLGFSLLFWVKFGME